MTVNQTKIGYARVSTNDQNLALQRDALTIAGCTEIYEGKASGKSVERIELDHCLRALRPGDTLSVWRQDRLGRSLPDLVRIVGDLETRGIAFESITDKIETGSAAGKLVMPAALCRLNDVRLLSTQADVHATGIDMDILVEVAALICLTRG